MSDWDLENPFSPSQPSQLNSVMSEIQVKLRNRAYLRKHLIISSEGVRYSLHVKGYLTDDELKTLIQKYRKAGWRKVTADNVDGDLVHVTLLDSC